MEALAIAGAPRLPTPTNKSQNLVTNPMLKHTIKRNADEKKASIVSLFTGANVPPVQDLSPKNVDALSTTVKPSPVFIFLSPALVFIVFLAYVVLSPLGIGAWGSFSCLRGPFSSWVVSYAIFLYVTIAAYTIATLTLSSLKQRSARKLLFLYCFCIAQIITIPFIVDPKLTDYKPLSPDCFPAQDVAQMVDTGECVKRKITNESAYDELCFAGVHEAFIWEGVQKKYSMKLDELVHVYKMLYELGKQQALNGMEEVFREILCNLVFIPCSPDCQQMLPCRELVDELINTYIRLRDAAFPDGKQISETMFENCTGVLNIVPEELPDVVLPMFGTTLSRIIWDVGLGGELLFFSYLGRISIF